MGSQELREVEARARPGQRGRGGGLAEHAVRQRAEVGDGGHLEHQRTVGGDQEVGRGRGREGDADPVAEGHAGERMPHPALADGGGGADLAGLDQRVHGGEALAGHREVGEQRRGARHVHDDDRGAGLLELG